MSKRPRRGGCQHPEIRSSVCLARKRSQIGIRGREFVLVRISSSFSHFSLANGPALRSTLFSLLSFIVSSCLSPILPCPCHSSNPRPQLTFAFFAIMSATEAPVAAPAEEVKTVETPAPEPAPATEAPAAEQPTPAPEETAAAVVRLLCSSF